MKHRDILIVDDDPATIKALGSVLCDIGKIRVATNGKDALALARACAPDVILLDAEMPDITGFQVCETLKANRETADTAIVFVTSHSEVAFEVAALEMGASDFLSKPINRQLVLARIKTLLQVKQLTDDLRAISRIDPLTSVPNRIFFEQCLDREWTRRNRSGSPLSLLLVNIDEFTNFNNRYGFHAGDECLRTISQSLSLSCLRPADMVSRYSGDEFALLLPETDREGATHISQRLFEGIHELHQYHSRATGGPFVTVSVGIGVYDQSSRDWQLPSAASRQRDPGKEQYGPGQLVRASIAALSEVKKSGRAHARMLDIGDCDNPGKSRKLEFASAESPAVEHA